MPEKTRWNVHHPALTFAEGKLQEAIQLHKQHATEANLLRVTDVGRFCVNVGASLASDAGMDRQPWTDLYERARRYCNGTLNAEQASGQREPSNFLLLDAIHELHRTIREVRELVKPAKRTVRKEAA